jgi:hypothetical protein
MHHACRQLKNHVVDDGEETFCGKKNYDGEMVNGSH